MTEEKAKKWLQEQLEIAEKDNEKTVKEFLENMQTYVNQEIHQHCAGCVNYISKANLR